MKRDMNSFAMTMRYQKVHGWRSDVHAVVSCRECHQMMLAMNLDTHVSGHVSGGIQDPTMTQVIRPDKKEIYVHA